MPNATDQMTQNLSLPYLMPGQALKYITHNEALRALDIRVQARVNSRTVSAPPPDAANGDAYVVPSSSPDWGFAEGAIAACQDGDFVAYPPHSGWLVWIADEGAYAHFDGTDWQTLETGSGGALPDIIDSLGINTSANTNNRLSVAANATLLSHDGDDHRLVINKGGETNTASLVFQSAYSGRAEFGLTGTNSVSLRVSPDGQSFEDAFIVQAGSANLRLPHARHLEFDVNSGGRVGQHRIGVSNFNLEFEKVSSDTKWGNGSAYIFGNCGARMAGNPFNQGIILNSPILLDNGVGRVPRLGMNWSFTNKFDPDDLSFNIEIDADGVDTDLHMNTDGQGAFRFRTSGGVSISDQPTAPLATLDVDGPVRVKSYQSSNLPTGVGAGSVIFVSDMAGGAGMAYFDGSDWRQCHDRQVV